MTELALSDAVLWSYFILSFTQVKIDCKSIPGPFDSGTTLCVILRTSSFTITDCCSSSRRNRLGDERDHGRGKERDDDPPEQPEIAVADPAVDRDLREIALPRLLARCPVPIHANEHEAEGIHSLFCSHGLHISGGIRYREPPVEAKSTASAVAVPFVRPG